MAQDNKANAPASAKKNVFGPAVAADTVVFRLLQRNPAIRPDTPAYPPYIRFPNTDIVLDYVDGLSDEQREQIEIRFLRGNSKIKVSDQEANGRVLPEGVINNSNNRFEIINGEIRVPVSDRARLLFLRTCNRNIDSKFRTGKVYPIFSEYSEATTAKALAEKQEAQKKAITKAFEASDAQIAFHARFLGVLLTDPVTQASRTSGAIIADYRQIAIDDPVNFLKTFDDKDLKDKFLIEQAFEDNYISDKLVAGKIATVSGKQELCDITPGLSAVDSLFQFSRTTKEGEDFLAELRKSNK